QVAPGGGLRVAGVRRANEFAATTTRSPPSRTTGRGVGEGLARATGCGWPMVGKGLRAREMREGCAPAGPRRRRARADAADRARNAGAAVARRSWPQSYRGLLLAQPGPERSGGTRPDPAGEVGVVAFDAVEADLDRESDLGGRRVELQGQVALVTGGSR